MVAKYQTTYYHMITVPVKEKFEILEVIEGEEDSPGRKSLHTPRPSRGTRHRPMGRTPQSNGKEKQASEWQLARF